MQKLTTSTGIRYIDIDMFWNSELISIYLQVLRGEGDRQSHCPGLHSDQVEAGSMAESPHPVRAGPEAAGQWPRSLKTKGGGKGPTLHGHGTVEGGLVLSGRLYKMLIPVPWTQSPSSSRSCRRSSTHSLTMVTCGTIIPRRKTRYENLKLSVN